MKILKDTLTEWCKLNELIVNSDKTVYSLYGKLSYSHELHIYVDKRKLKSVPEFIDNTLSFSAQ